MQPWVSRPHYLCAFAAGAISQSSLPQPALGQALCCSFRANLLKQMRERERTSEIGCPSEGKICWKYLFVTSWTAQTTSSSFYLWTELAWNKKIAHISFLPILNYSTFLLKKPGPLYRRDYANYSATTCQIFYEASCLTGCNHHVRGTSRLWLNVGVWWYRSEPP